jgi:hypothetical protein
LLAGGLFGVKNVLASHRETIIGRIIAAIYKRMQCMNLAITSPVSHLGISTQKRATTLVRIRLRSMGANLVGKLGANF